MKTVTMLISYMFLLYCNFAKSQDKIDLLILDGKYNEALQLIDDNLMLNDDVENNFRKGQVLGLMQRYSEAISAYEEAEKLKPDNIKILGEIAECHSILGNYIEARGYFEKITNYQPLSIELLVKAGRNYINLKDFKNAYSCFSEVCSNDTTNIYWNKQLAFCAYRVGKRKESIELYSNVLKCNSRDYSTYLNLVKIFEKGKDDSMIVETYRKGIDQFPDDAEMRGELARFYFDIRAYEKAKENFEIYFSLEGDSVYTMLQNYGICLYFTGNDSLSVSILEKCVNQLANDQYALFYIALGYKRLRNFEISEQYFKAAIEAATPAYLPDMYHHLGQVLGLQRKFPESINALQKANELDPENKEALFEIATTYEEFNANKTLALNYYKLYLKEAGENGKNVEYAIGRMKKIKEELFFEK